jgi:hypothetical protein
MGVLSPALHGLVIVPFAKIITQVIVLAAIQTAIIFMFGDLHVDLIVVKDEVINTLTLQLP